MEYAMEERDINVGDQGVEDIVQGVEDETQNEKGDPERQDDQNPRKNLGSKMSEKRFCHALGKGSSRIFFRSVSSTTSFSSKRRASSPNLSFLAVSISLTLRYVSSTIFFTSSSICLAVSSLYSLVGKSEEGRNRGCFSFSKVT